MQQRRLLLDWFGRKLVGRFYSVDHCPSTQQSAAAADPSSMSPDAQQLGSDAHYNVSFGTERYNNCAGMGTLNKLWTCCNLHVRCSRDGHGPLYKTQLNPTHHFYNPTQPNPRTTKASSHDPTNPTQLYPTSDKAAQNVSHFVVLLSCVKD